MHAARRRWVGLAVLAALALGAHWLAFSGLGWVWPRQPAAAPTAAVETRGVDPMPVAPTPASADAAPKERSTPAPVAPLRVVAAQPRAPAVSPAPTATPAAAPVPAPVQSIATPVEAVAAVDTVPRYRTQMPPPLTLRYLMQRGSLQGIGELSWRPLGDDYTMRFEARVAGLAVLTQVSTGGFDAAGIAPLRFTDQRVRRGVQAANFQRDAGTITFSGPSTTFALRDGAQDRLSWMVQLGAIVAAEPRLREVGAKVLLYVVGASGDAGVWAFDCTAVETVSTGAGPADALKFVREPREPYDTRVQVWIDPARHFMPVRAEQQSGANDAVFELRLQSIDVLP